MVMDYLKDREEITNRIARELTGITSENVIKDVFLSLNKRELLERVPDKLGNASAWRKFTGHWKEQTESLLDLMAADPPVEEPAAGPPAAGETPKVPTGGGWKRRL
jgi:ATP-dependent DNA helicase RecG